MSEGDRLQLQGAVRLAGEATCQAAEIVEAMHTRISPLGGRRTARGRVRARGVSGVVYAMVRGIAAGVSAALARALGAVPGEVDGAESPSAQALRSALNGVSGNHLADRANPLHIEMSLRHEGRRLPEDPEGLGAAVPQAGGRVLLLVHGLCMNDRQWRRRGHDHGAALAAELGYTPLYLRYNTGLHISENGLALAALLERLVDAWPCAVAELTILGHSMGGLVARSACDHAARSGMRWPAVLRHLVFLGTPHHGAPLERGGNRLHQALAATRVTAPLARLGAMRSAGITDLRFGSIAAAAGDRFAPARAAPGVVPLPAGVACFAAAATLGRREGDLRDRLFGDGLVPVRSALGRGAAEPLVADPANAWVRYGIGHLDLLSDPEVYRRIRGWLSGAAAPRA